MRTTTTNTWRSLEQDTEHAKEHSMRTLEEVMEDRHWFETALVTQPDLSAEQSANAQFVLGSMSYEGIGGPKDHAEAVRLFGLAAKQGHAYAQNSLGLMLREGEGGPQDYTEARRLLGLAAAQGNTMAQFVLGVMHWEGEGGPEDFAEARRLLSLALFSGKAGRKTIPRHGACMGLRQRRTTPRL